MGGVVAADTLEMALSAPGVLARAGGPADAIDGVCPAAVGAPHDLAAAADLLRAAAGAGAAVGVRGGGGTLGLGNPPRRLDLLVDTRRLDRLVEYNPGDLVVRAEAGLRLADLQRLLAGQGQLLGLDPPEPDATLGGIVAANLSGPRRLRYGTARDLLLGVTAVLADGSVARAGGRVVKNVAGYDLCKLYVGSLGTLALLAELTFRLHPRPTALRVVEHQFDDLSVAGAAVSGYRRTQLTPTALELLAGPDRDCWQLVAVFEGPPAAVAVQAETAAALGPAATVSDRLPPEFGERPFGPTDCGLRIAYQPDALVTALRAVSDAAKECRLETRIAAHAAVGVAWVGIAGNAGTDATVRAVGAMRAWLAPVDGTLVVHQAPQPVKSGLDVWGPVRGAALMRRVKDQFDPQARLSPGRFAAGI